MSPQDFLGATLKNFPFNFFFFFENRPYESRFKKEVIGPGGEERDMLSGVFRLKRSGDDSISNIFRLKKRGKGKVDTRSDPMDIGATFRLKKRYFNKNSHRHENSLPPIIPIYELPHY